MLKKWGVLLIFSMLTAATALAQVPDPWDSIILESKTLAPGLTGNPAFTIKLSITNKDSITFLTFVCRESSLVGSAYVLLNRSPGGALTFGSVVTPLTNTLRYFANISVSSYNDHSPDRFLIAAGFDGSTPETIEPPNAARKPIWELKFRHSSDSAGQVILENSTIAGLVSLFTNTAPVDAPVNFLPAILTLAYRGDLDMSTVLTPADAVLILYAVMQNLPPPAGFGACDLNCDGERTLADVMLLMNAVFGGEGFPC
ncbi:MAG TPA: hypothetical protein VNL73_09390 [Verrucomicrobiae bacterium]|nr:hypothetical protein [Verrucomicrobiae bacterium]